MRRAALGGVFTLACVAEFPPPQGGGSDNTSASSSESTSSGASLSESASTDPTGASSDDGDPTGPESECGNRIIEMGELCDAGPENGMGPCKVDCTLNYCGDGYVGPGELCDGELFCAAASIVRCGLDGMSAVEVIHPHACLIACPALRPTSGCCRKAELRAR